MANDESEMTASICYFDGLQSTRSRERRRHWGPAISRISAPARRTGNLIRRATRRATHPTLRVPTTLKRRPTRALNCTLTSSKSVPTAPPSPTG